ncbi:MAG: nucleotide sugar dehydrogenase, partial [Candidatus Omnitrophica bacterium]|nr:nucleotide sugar dehydrogenase [Candidatus Omnitrophota bacterium]
KSAVKAISRNIKKGALVILESTTYPGTTEEVILPIFEKRGLLHGKDFFLCFSPERIDPGNIKFPLQKIPKVIGGINREATGLGCAIYNKIIQKTVPVSSARVAESVKLLENTFRLINIALIDELSMMAHKMKIDIWEIIDAAATKPFGFMPFYPGPGVGGHCIPKDPLYLYWKAKHHGFVSRFIKLSSDVISFMPVYIVNRLEDILAKSGKHLAGANILVCGVTYKKDIKDLRKSPALDMIGELYKRKAKVSYYDPLIPYLNINQIDLKSSVLSVNNLKKIDCVIIATDHSAVDYDFLLKNSRTIFDTRNIYKKYSGAKVVKL